MISHDGYAAKDARLTHEVVLRAWAQQVVEPLMADEAGTTLHTFLCFRPAGR